MRKITLLFALSISFTCQLNAQIDTLKTIDSLRAVLIDRVDETGIYHFKSNVMRTGEVMSKYPEVFYPNDYSYAVKMAEWVDKKLGYTHIKYQQYFGPAAVEGGQLIEHSKDGFVLYVNGKVGDLQKYQAPTTIMSDLECWNALVAAKGLEGHELAYENEDWEEQARLDADDPSATFYPPANAEIVMAINDARDLGAVISKEKFTVAYKFDVLSLSPSYHKAFYVNAVNGEVFRESDLRHYDGPASIWYHGTQTIDTKSRGWPYNDHVLVANSDQRNFETRYASNWAWWQKQKIDDDDDQWGSDNHGATAIHWFTMKSWDYFNDVHQWLGMDSVGGEIRIHADGDIDQAYFAMNSGIAKLYFGQTNGSYHGRAIDLVGHEFTHGITYNTANLMKEFEPGALNESFSDILGQLVEFYVEGTTASWIMADDEPGLKTRSLINPKLAGEHPNGDCSEYFIGQPNTYQGEFWCDCDFECDQGGIHTNSGVQNRWFYLLSSGGSGVNDNSDNFNVFPIGLDAAADLVFWTLTNELSSGSQYVDSRALTLQAAIEMFGECSYEHIQVQNAWYAVGLGDPSDCEGVGLEDRLDNKIKIFPNPGSDEITIVGLGLENGSGYIISIDGKLIKRFEFRSDKLTLDIAELKSGVYVVSIITQKGRLNQKLIKR